MPSFCAVDNDGAITVSEVIVVAEDDLMEFLELWDIFSIIWRCDAPVSSSHLMRFRNQQPK